MVLKGTIKNGVVVLTSPAPLPDGTPVVVEPLAEKPWKKFIGAIDDQEAREMIEYIEKICEQLQ